MIDTQKLLKKAGGYSIAASGAVTDPILLEIASQYELMVSKKMQAIKPQEFSKRFIGNDDVLETTKYDGEGVFIYFDLNSGLFCFNAPSGRVRMGLPVMRELHEHLKSLGLKKGLFRAELYVSHNMRGQRPGIAEVIRISFNGNENELCLLKLAFLDIIMIDGKDLRANCDQFLQTWNLLAKYFGNDPMRSFHRMEGSILPENQLVGVFDKKTAAGLEGIVIRRLNRFDIYKVKPHLAVDAAVIGYIEGEWEGQIGVTSILTGLTYPEVKSGPIFLQTFARIGSGFTDKQRGDLLQTLTPYKVHSPITMTDSDGRTVSFVKPYFVLELEGDDLITSTWQDRVNRTQLFSWNDSHFQFHGLTSCPRLSFPIFNRMRPDKDLRTGGARLEQIMKCPSIPVLKPTAPQETKVLKREVYVKAEMVRKLLIIHRIGEDIIPYAIYWTDFSAKRKEPLKVNVAFAYNESRASKLADKFILENVTKGFNLIK